MRELIWKEWRERRPWALLLVASTVGVVAFRQGYTFWLDPGLGCNFVLLSMVIALLMGTSVYSGELERSVADFLYSRPIPWKKVLASKLIVGFGIITLAAALAAVAFRIVCHEPYIRFMTLGFWAKGMGLALLLMGIPYLFGAACSVVLPGMVGGVLVALTLLVGLGTEIALFTKVIRWQTPYWAMIAWFAGALAGTLLVLRFGLTLPLGRRAGRYALAVTVAVVCISPLRFFVWPDGQPNPSAEHTMKGLWLSPDGKFAAVVTVRWSRDIGEIQRIQMVRLSDGKVATMPFLSDYGPWWVNWAADGTAYGLENERSGSPTQGAAIITIKMETSGRLVQTRIPLRSSKVGGRLVPSPDRRLAAYLKYYSPQPQGGRDTNRAFVQFIDIIHKRTLGAPVDFGIVKQCFWQSETEFAWIDNQDQRHTIRVPR